MTEQEALRNEFQQQVMDLITDDEEGRAWLNKLFESYDEETIKIRRAAERACEHTGHVGD